jgi:hypothetical protein
VAVASAVEGNNQSPIDVIETSKLLEIQVTGYRIIYAYGMHLIIHIVEGDKINCDNAVASAIFRRGRDHDQL